MMVMMMMIGDYDRIDQNVFYHVFSGIEGSSAKGRRTSAQSSG
jgi:hypothetical protein